MADGDRELTIHQGDDLGRPSRLRLRMAAGDLRMRVAGAAVAMDG